MYNSKTPLGLFEKKRPQSIEIKVKCLGPKIQIKGNSGAKMSSSLPKSQPANDLLVVRTTSSQVFKIQYKSDKIIKCKISIISLYHNQPSTQRLQLKNIIPFLIHLSTMTHPQTLNQVLNLMIFRGHLVFLIILIIYAIFNSTENRHVPKIS